MSIDGINQFQNLIEINFSSNSIEQASIALQ